MVAKEGGQEFRKLVQEYLRQALPHPDGRRFTQYDLAAAIGLDAKEFSQRLNDGRGRRLSATTVRDVVRVLAERGALTTVPQVDELLALAGVTPLSDAERQKAPFSKLYAVATSSSQLSPENSNSPPQHSALNTQHSLAAFREQLRELYRRADPYGDGRRPRQQDLAEAIGLAPTELSRRLNGLGNTPLTAADVRAIVRALAEWEAISTRSEATALLHLMAAPDFSAAEWASPPLDLLTATPSPLTSAVTPPNNLPRTLTSFIGRASQLDECAALLDSHPLVTLTGPGGVGKTRFSLELAKRLLPRYPAGIYFVELTTTSDPELVPQAIATALALRGEATASLTEQLITYLRDKSLLLVLDNCEQVSDAVAVLAQQLLTRCPTLTILATSRERLGVNGETLFPLRALLLPTKNHTAPADLAAVEAAQLFVARARAVQPDFSISEQNAAGIAEVVSSLEGMPLAIELAAPLVQALSVQQLARRLEQRLQWLVSQSPALPARQRSLQASIAWSYDLLAADEQLLFRRLAVFSGGWELAAAESICSGGDPAEGGVLRALTRLVRASLVQATPQADGEMRYTWLVTVREFATEQLAASGEAEAVARRHASLYLALVEQVASQLTGPMQTQHFARLEHEHDNLRAALRWSLDRGERDLTLRLAGGLWRFWSTSGYLTEGRSWLEQALADSNKLSAAKAKALQGLGVIALYQSDYPAATTALEQALALHREANDREELAATLNSLGQVFWRQGNSERARACCEEALTVYRELGDKGGIKSALGNIAIIDCGNNDYASAQPRFEEVLQLAREAGGPRSIANALGNLGMVLQYQGDFDTALKIYEESRTLFEQIGARAGIANSLLNVGDVLHSIGDIDGAEVKHRASLETFRDIGDIAMIAYVFERLARVAISRAQGEQAARLLAAAIRLRDETNSIGLLIEQTDLDSDIAAARQLLDGASFATAWQEGQSWALADTIAYALGNRAAPQPAELEPASVAVNRI